MAKSKKVRKVQKSTKAQKSKKVQKKVRATVVKKTVKKAVARAPKKAAKKLTKKRKPVAKNVARKAAPKKVAPRKAAPKKVAPKKAAPKKVATKKVAPKKVAPKKVAPKKAAPKKAAVKAAVPPPPARLNRDRKRLADVENSAFSAEAEDSRLLQSARSGHDELASELRKHTETSPELTAGDVDANWQDAYAVGDEAPGGDNPTPDQDRVDDIGRALGVEYDDDEELMGGAEISERDSHRWELDPASKDDDE